MTATLSRPLREDLKAPRDSVAFIDVPIRRFLATDGAGDPDGSPDYARAIRSLHAVGYTLKLSLKRARGITTRMAPLEALWTTESRGAFDAASKAHFQWTLLLATPDQTTDQEVEAAIAAAATRNPSLADRVRVETIAEGRSAQTLHIGPYCTEPRSIERLHEAIIQAGVVPAGRHHEIYLGDPRRTAPSRLRTIIRQPVRSVS